MENLKKYAFSVVAGDADLEAPREKIEGTPKHSCQWRDLNIRRAAEIEALEWHIRELSWQLELERSERDLDKTKRRIKKLKKKLSRGV